VLDAAAALWHSAALGSDVAAATLGYMCLVCTELRGIDRVEALRLCRESANHDFNYAQYVIAWLEYELGNHGEFVKWINRSARRRFPPAICDLGRLALTGSMKSGNSATIAIKFFRLSIRAGHFMSIMFFLRFCKEGKFGGPLKIAGIFALPIAHLLFLPVTWCHPFSLTAFIYPASQKQNLFRSM
jgi:hypothetical protein